MTLLKHEVPVVKKTIVQKGNKEDMLSNHYEITPLFRLWT